MCSGALTAEMSRSVLQKYANATGWPMDIKTLALWVTRLTLRKGFDVFQELTDASEG